MDNTPLSYPVEELERHLSGKVMIVGSGLASRKISGTIAISDIATALDYLERALGLSATRVGPVIVLRE